MSLPYTYQQVEYIEGTGTQYIDTGYIPQGNTEVRADIQFTHTSATYDGTHAAIFGASSSDKRFYMNFGAMNQQYNQIFFWNGANNETTVWATLNNVTLKHKFIFNNIGLKVDNTLYAKQGTLVACTRNFLFFTYVNRTTGNVNLPSKYKLYNGQIYENDVLVRDLVPCYRKSDEEIGLYDLVNDAFYTNAGTGTFIKGPSLAPITTKLEYLNETKELIKQAIIDKGQTITAQDTFRSYISKIDNVPVVDSKNWSNIGYSHREPQVSINDGFEYALEILNNWQNISNLSEKFLDDGNLKYMPLVDCSNVTNMTRCFKNCYGLETVASLNTSNVTNMTEAFRNCRALKTVPNLDFSNVTNLSYAFDYCASLEHFDANSINTSKVTNWAHTFEGCYKLTDEEIQKFDFSGASGNLENMFAYCEGLTNISIPSMPNVTAPNQMFVFCKNLKTINLPNMPKLASTYAPFHSSGIETIIAFDTSHAANVSQLFYNASRITNIPVMDFSNVTYFGNIFFYSSGSRFTDQSLNNLMESLISATKYTGTKTLKYINLPKVKCQRCMELEKYQDFIASGWTTGY